MGCGASGNANRAVSPEQAQEIALRLQKQSEQILELERAQMQLATQVSVLQRTLHSNNGCLRVAGMGTGPSIPGVGDTMRSLENGPQPLALGDREREMKSERQEKGALPLIPALQTYNFGKPWDRSMVARYAEAIPDCKLSKGLHYAEMWMGTHPSGPSFVRLEGLDGVGHSKAGLKETIGRSPQFWLGTDVQRGDLPFMMKVLSVGQATSLQAHPDKMRAQQFHESFPDKFKDPNERQEICLPLGEYEGLVGFRPFEDILRSVDNIRELSLLLQDKFTSSSSLKDLFGILLRSDPDTVRHHVSSLVRRLDQCAPEELSPEENVVLKLQRSFPGDVGIFCVFFMNYVHIRPDQRRRYIYCPPNEPHCHISGDCIICMSVSDNAVHAGFTPHKDVEPFVEMLSYRHGRLGSLTGAAKPFSKHMVGYATPGDDFRIYEVEGGKTGSSGDDPVLDLPRASICFCARGSFSATLTAGEPPAETCLGQAGGPVEEIRVGQSLFLRAGSSVVVHRSDPGSRLFIATY
mmetsp:Transcript_26107/g.78040  ORF Transcript_26107/g.78040 Transcript_26107/m.78040 type:complete len:521 (+) Transcript_26107:52-1614(+)